MTVHVATATKASEQNERSGTLSYYLSTLLTHLPDRTPIWPTKSDPTLFPWWKAPSN